jgi:predicted HicB family RNase H-like nuclease
MPKYTIGPDVDLDKEIIEDSAGRRIDQAYVDEVVESANSVRATRGRPALSSNGEASVSVSLRLTPELKARADEVARQRGTTVSKLARQALELELNRTA